MIKLLDYFNITVTQLVTFLITVKIFYVTWHLTRGGLQCSWRAGKNASVDEAAVTFGMFEPSSLIIINTNMPAAALRTWVFYSLKVL
jgi:hypothetical protein